MKPKFRLFRRATGIFYIEDTVTRLQESLKTKNREIAKRLWHSKNEACIQPAVNLQIARAYLCATDPSMQQRTWNDALKTIIDAKHGPTKNRWESAAKDRAFNTIRDRVLIETQAEHLIRVLKTGTVSTNVHLRKLHNFCVAMNWIPWPIVPKRQWPPVVFREQRAVSLEEHQLIVAAEHNPEKKAFYELAWHLGAAQGDLANLQAEEIDWDDRVIAFRRKKTLTPSLIHFSDDIESVLSRLPSRGFLFPHLQSISEKRRADYFRKRCRILGIVGVTLHSYRYAWAERARRAGYPERFAQEALGHNSKAIHRAYAKRATVKVPSLEDFEKQMKKKVIPIPGLVA